MYNTSIKEVCIHIHWMCCLLHLWTLVGTLVKCICILGDKCLDDVMMMSCGGTI